MAATYYEKITETIANDETKLKEWVQAKVIGSCYDNWLNGSIVHGVPDALPLTPSYVSASVLDKEWKYFQLTNSIPDPYPRVVLFKPPVWSKTFAMVRAKDKSDLLLWDLHDTTNFHTDEIYAALVPAGFMVQFLHADVKYFSPREILVHKGEPKPGPSKANERSGESGESTPRQPEVVDRGSGEDSGESTPRQHGVVDRGWGNVTPRQPGAADSDMEL